MRFYLKKTTQWILGVFVMVAILLNVYKRDVWIYDKSAQVPWGPNFLLKEGRRKHLDFFGLPIHEHVLRVRSNFTTGKGNSFLSREKGRTLNPNAYIYYDKVHNDLDRIVNQLNFVSRNVQEKRIKGEEVPFKTILIYHGFGGWQVKRGQQTFVDEKCAVNRCLLSDDRQKAEQADAVFFHHSPTRPWFTRPLNQIWILFMLESPYHTAGLSAFKNTFNWTASYRHDSTIVAPYERFVPFNYSQLTKPQNKDYAEGKTKKVAWFVSNCGARNGRRKYADELAKYIDVDIYGSCGKLKCPRYQSNKCFDMLNKDYKFYLAFENSNCRDYITEKFFVNGLQHDVIPIVMGASPEDYRRAAPIHSHIHVDDYESPKALAEYLHKLDKNNDLYNEYFQWKGTGSLINTYFWCRVCNVLHDTDRKPSWFADVDNWWRGPDVCIGQDTWRKRLKLKQ